jgi:hypothetical protein
MHGGGYCMFFYGDYNIHVDRFPLPRNWMWDSWICIKNNEKFSCAL